jgi:prepilin-type N-terminal cleavage/methylation domain-containing protein
MKILRFEYGFSLMEVLVAVAIMAIIALSIMSLFTGSLLLNTSTTQNTKALYYAQEKMEEFKSMSFGEVKKLLPDSPLLEELIQDSSKFSRISEIELIDEELLKITVRVCWDNNEVKLVTLKTKR